MGHVVSCEGTPRVPISAESIAALVGEDAPDNVRAYLRSYDSAWVLQDDPAMRDIVTVFQDEIGPRQKEVCAPRIRTPNTPSNPSNPYSL